MELNDYMFFKHSLINQKEGDDFENESSIMNLIDLGGELMRISNNTHSGFTYPSVSDSRISTNANLAHFRYSKIHKLPFEKRASDSSSLGCENYEV